VAPSIRNWLTFLRLKLKMVARKPLFFLVFLLARILKPSLVLTYDNEALCDGTGAQLQRLMAIYSLAKSLHFKYLHTPIKDVSVHPLDPHQTLLEYEEYLNRLNSFIEFPTDFIPSENLVYAKQEIPNLNLSNLLILLFSKTKGFRVIKLVDIYSVIDCVPKIYHHAGNILIPKHFQPNLGSSNTAPTLAVHYRSVPGEFSIYEGEGQTRQLQISRVEKAISRAVKKFDSKEFELIIFTDAPPNDMTVDVFASQQHLWEGTPGYANGKLHLRGRSLHRSFTRFTSNIKVVVGGDPLDTITKMATADILITSKSSLSYVPAILSLNSFVYSPLEFWHQIPNSGRF
jgi:hypothetical protein